MNKKTAKISCIIIFIVFVTIIGLIFSVKAVLQNMRHESMLNSDSDLLCLTLSVAHGCDTEEYDRGELKKYLNERVLTKISAEEVEKIVKKKRQEVIDARNESSKDNSYYVEMQKNREEQCEKGEYAVDSKSDGEIIGYTCRKVDSIVYFDEIISIIQEMR